MTNTTSEKKGNDTWFKNWAGRWSLCFCSFYGHTYTKGLEKLVGKEISDYFLTFEPDVSLNFLSKNDLTKICKHLARLVINNEKIAKKWCQLVIKETDNFSELLKTISKQRNVGFKEYLNLRNIIYKHIPPNFAVKKVADYLPPDILEKYLEDFSYIRVYSETVYNDTDKILRKIFSNIAKTTRYPEKLLLTLTKTELELYFKTNQLPEKDTLEERYNGCALRYHNGKEEIILGKKFNELKSKLTNQGSSNDIKGSTAFPGIARGKVKIVFDPLKTSDFNKGDILVTGMTRPDFLGLMKKSAAFITDAGGMLSHAAIVARELKKPCIVGTQIATKVLKNGDIVEVNANNGTVKIIN